jgi:hypothetical protein
LGKYLGAENHDPPRSDFKTPIITKNSDESSGEIKGLLALLSYYSLSAIVP